MCADTTTSNYHFVKPEVGASATTWGTKLNSDLDMIDAQLFTSAGALNSNSLVLNSNPGTAVSATLTFGNGSVATAQQARWVWTEDTSSEVGGNAGSNLSLTAHNDTGALLSTPIAINRASGAITFGNAVSFPDSATFTGAATFGALTAATVSATGSVSTTTLVANAITSNGALSATGAGTVSGGLTVGSGLSVTSGGAGINGGLSVANGLTVTSGASGFTGAVSINGNLGVTGTLTSGAHTASAINLPNGGNISTPSGGTLNCDPGGSWQMTNGSSGNLILNNNSAFKPGGGSWAALSDARIKTVTGEYEAGLGEVLQLRPVTYVYKTGADREFVGLVAQEVERTMPRMVGRQKGFIDGEEVADLRTLDTTELVFALVNCVKQLKAEIEALKAR